MELAYPSQVATSKIDCGICLSHESQIAGIRLSTKNGAHKMTNVKNTTPSTLVAFCSSLMIRPCLVVLRIMTLELRPYGLLLDPDSLVLAATAAIRVLAALEIRWRGSGSLDSSEATLTACLTVALRRNRSLLELVVGASDTEVLPPPVKLDRLFNILRVPRGSHLTCDDFGLISE